MKASEAKQLVETYNSTKNTQLLVDIHKVIENAAKFGRTTIEFNTGDYSIGVCEQAKKQLIEYGYSVRDSSGNFSGERILIITWE